MSLIFIMSLSEEGKDPELSTLKIVYMSVWRGVCMWGHVFILLNTVVDITIKPSMPYLWWSLNRKSAGFNI